MVPLESSQVCPIFSFASKHKSDFASCPGKKDTLENIILIKDGFFSCEQRNVEIIIIMHMSDSVRPFYPRGGERICVVGSPTRRRTDGRTDGRPVLL